VDETERLESGGDGVHAPPVQVGQIPGLEVGAVSLGEEISGGGKLLDRSTKLVPKLPPRCSQGDSDGDESLAADEIVLLMPTGRQRHEVARLTPPRRLTTTQAVCHFRPAAKFPRTRNPSTTTTCLYRPGTGPPPDAAPRRLAVQSSRPGNTNGGWSGERRNEMTA
jgi:hypothetical protein